MLSPPLRLDNVPAELRRVPQWVCWRYITRNGKPTKCPFSAADGPADSTDPSTWSSFNIAVAARKAGHCEGVGFVFTKGDPFCGIDLDGCIDNDNAIVPAAREIINALNSYTEVSPSGRGVKIFIAGRKPDGAGCRSKAMPGFKETEIYDCGRFFTVTGQHLAGTPGSVEERQAELDALCARLWPKNQNSRATTTTAATDAGVVANDEEILEWAYAAKNGDRFAKLWAGDTSSHGDDHSAADLALCAMLAFWTGKDAERMDRMFRNSGLFREKWDEKRGARTYGQMTLSKAIADCRETYSPRRLVERASPIASRDGDSDTPDNDGTLVSLGRPDPATGRLVLSPRRTLPTAEAYIREFPCTDLGNAERFADRCRDRLRYCHALGAWYTWDGKRWREDQVGVPVRLAGETARSILGEAERCDDGGRRKELAKWAVESEYRPRLEAMVALARSQRALAVTVDQLDADQWVFNTLSGTVDLRTGELRPQRREDLITKLAPVHYNASATCPKWDAFLLRIMAGDTGLISYLARFFGYALSGGIELQHLPILHGVGANGKSVFTDTIKAIMGDYACDAPPSLLVKSGRDEHPTEIADLLGRRLVIASETEDGASFKLQLVKRLTGDATLKARRMRQDFFEFHRTHKTVMVTNNRPRVREDSEAVWRRLHLVPFSVVIPKEERDSKLLEKLRAEWPGILAWLVRGCIECQRDGLKPPQAVLAATAEYRGVEDAVGRFIAERCIEDTKEFSLEERSVTPWKVLLDAYLKWCDDCGEKAMNGRRFGEALDKRGISSDTRRVVGKPCKVRVGIQLSEATGESQAENRGDGCHSLPM